MSEDKTQIAISRGRRAQAQLDDELVSEAFKTLEASYLKAWGETHPAETAAREHYWQAVQILGDVRKHLGKVASNGRLAQKELDQLGGLNRL